MPERADAGLYVANLRALFPALRHHFATLVAEASTPTGAAALVELGHLATTIAELSAAFRVEDCALVATALTDGCVPAGARALDDDRLATLADALAYIEARLNAIEQQGRVMALDTHERMEVVRLLTRLAAPDARSTAPPLAASAPLVDAAATLSAEDAAIVRAFQAQSLRPLATAMTAQAPAKASATPTSAGALGMSVAGDEDEDVAAIPGAYRGLILTEVGEDLLELRQALLAFEQDPTLAAQVEAAAHIAHKIKGEAGMLEGAHLDSLVHDFEELLGAVRGQRVAADTRAAGLLLRALEEVERVHAALISDQPAPDVVPRLRALTALLLEGAAPGVSDQSGTHAVMEEPSGPVTPGTTRVLAEEPLLRVDLRRMDDLSRRVGALAANRIEMTRTRATVAGLQGELERTLERLGMLSAKVTDLRPLATGSPDIVPATASLPAQVARLLADMPGFETMPPMPAMPAMPAADAVPFAANVAANEVGPARMPEVERYTEYDQLALALGETVADVETCGHALRSALAALDGLTQEQEGLAADIQQAIMQVRMIPLRDHILPLQHSVRKLAKEHGKTAILRVRDEMTEIDREVSDGLGEVLLQLVRNAVFHGIEPPEERVEHGKPAQGTIWIYAYATGSEVNIQVSDDGRGINPDAVIAAARLRGLLDAETAQTLRQADALNLIFQHGFSTLPEATVAAGHGIGMAEVAARLASLHGTIQVQSIPGQGTLFHLRVPISFSNLRALEVRVAGQGYIIPATFVRQTVPLDIPATGEQSATGSAGAARRLHVASEYDGEHIEEDLPVIPLAELVGRPYLAAPREVALVADLGRQRAAVVVESVVAESEVVVRSLPPHLRRRAARGATITPGGEVLLLLDLPELVARAMAGDRPRLSAPPTEAPDIARPAVLVVDDSITLRRTLESTLTHAGYAVATAHDGMEALELILRAPPRLILLDIEMPRLDGYELLTLLRARKDLADVRVAMLTSKATARHRRHAELLGANAFLVKPVTDEELLATVARLLALPA